MEHVIIGTAGHIDHGKTTLIKALTGRETDTLKEEKERGISINLGFTYFDLPSGRRAGIVDVPGHERFIKNMLAGVGGIDIVLLVIAADEGVMPQTREHLNILELLDIKKGIVVLTKVDMVEDEWLEMIKEEVKKEMESTFLKNAPVHEVSSVTGKGIKELAEMMDKMTMELPEKDNVTDFRIPVDRVFTVSGFGTVITGTLISGSIQEGDSCEIYTRGTKTKIRGIHVHEKPVKEAYAGQRVALNLANVKTEDVERGNVISKPGIMETSLMLDCRLRYLKDSSRPLNNRDRVRVYHGTSEILARVVILDKESVNPGESALIQLRLEGPIAARRGDKYVIRSYSPMHTIGGGTIIEPNPARHKAFDKRVINELSIKEKGDPSDVIEQAIKNSSKFYPRIEDIIKISGRGVSNIEGIMASLMEKKRIFQIPLSDGNVYIHSNFLSMLEKKSLDTLDEFHGNNPLKAGISKEEYKNKVFGKEVKQKIFDAVLEMLKKDTIETGEAFVWKKGFTIRFDKRQEDIKNKLLNQYAESKFQPPSVSDMLKSFGREEKAAKAVFDVLVDMNRLVKLSEDIYLTIENLNIAKDLLVGFINKYGEITAAQYRDEIGASRKYAVAILEYFDAAKITRRVEDKRILL